MKKRILSIFLAAMMVLTMIPVAAVAAVAASATPNWYEANATDLYIYNVSDMLAFGAQVKAAGNYSSSTDNVGFKGQIVHIMADIDMSDVDWFSIIGRNRAFGGFIDGHGHTISNITFSAPAGNTGNSQGGILGGRLHAKDTSTNIYEKYGAYAGVKDLTISITTMSVVSATQGGLYGITKADASTGILFENVTVNADITSTENQAGGIVGVIDSVGTRFINCVVNGSVSGTTYIGGFFGKNQSEVDLKNCIINATVTGNNYVGGFVGYSYSSKNLRMLECVSNATISADGGTNTGNTYLGGFIGASDCVLTIDKCAFYGTVKATNTSGNSKVSALIGGAAPTADCTFIDLCAVTVKDTIVGGTISGAGSPIGYCGAIIGVAGSRIKAGVTFSNVVTDVIAAGVLNNIKQYSDINANIPKNITKVETFDVSTGNNASLAGESADVSSFFATMPTGYPMPLGVVNMVRGDSTGTEYLGYQNGTNSVRFVAGGTNTDYTGVGFDISVYANGALVSGGNTQTTDKVYGSIMGNVNGVNVTYTNEELDVDYIYTISCDNIPADKEITFVVKTYHVEDSATVYDDIYVVTVG